jgi:small subunit ribosomal protein S7
MRRRKSEVRLIKPDPQFSDKLVTRFINSLMKDGKKNVARKILYQAFEIIEEKTGKPGIEVFRTAMTNAAPVLEVKSPPCGRIYLPGAHRGPLRAQYRSQHAMDH